MGDQRHDRFTRIDCSVEFALEYIKILSPEQADAYCTDNLRKGVVVCPDTLTGYSMLHCNFFLYLERDEIRRGLFGIPRTSKI